MSINHTFGLNIRVLSFNLPKNLIKDSDDIRVSITTIPEENKQAFVIPARKMKDPHIVFGVNINIPQEDLPNEFVSTGTEKIIVVFRKKSFFKCDSIVASTIIESKDFPKNLSEAASNKEFKIYEPVSRNDKKYENKYNGICEIQQYPAKKINRNVIGFLQVQMSLTDPFHLKDYKDNQMFDIENDTIGENHDYTNDLFKIGQNHFRFRVLD